MKRWSRFGDSVVKFDSLPEAIDFVKSTKPLDVNTKFFNDSLRDLESSPDFSYSLQNCFKILSTPPDCVEKIMELSDGIVFEKAVVPRNKLRRNLYEGEMVDVQAFINKQQNCFEASEISEQPKKTAKILINLSASSKEDVNVLYYRASAAIAIANNLEAMGIRVQLDVIIVVYNISPNFRDNSRCGIKVALIRLKRYEDPLDINTASVMADLKFVRGFFIPMMYCLANSEMKYGCGTPCEPPNDLTEGYDVYMGRNMNSKSKVEELLKGVAEKFDLGEYKEIA